MKLNKLFLITSAVLLIAATPDKDKKWDVNNPTGTFKEVSFTVTEGTWMNLDLSPDGKSIVFDLLGDIYAIPSTGGTAVSLKVATHGNANLDLVLMGKTFVSQVMKAVEIIFGL